MARIKPATADRDAVPSFTQGAQGGAADAVQADLAGIFGHRPEQAGAVAALYGALTQSGTISGRLKELIRLRIAFFNQCRTCMAMRYHEDVTDEGLVCSLERPQEAPDLSDAERAALHFADLFATDHLAIDDAAYDALREHFDEGELVELGMLCAYTVGFGRLAATWHVVDNLPEEFARGDVGAGAVTPWGRESSISAIA